MAVALRRDCRIRALPHAFVQLGTDEAALRSTLSKQGFTGAPQARTSCIKPEAKGIEYGPCPAGAQQMTYDYKYFGDLVCGMHSLTIVWSVDPNG